MGDFVSRSALWTDLLLVLPNVLAARIECSRTCDVL